MNRRLEVLQVIDGLWVGGTERSLVEMLPHFESQGIDVRIACLRRRSEGVEDLVPPERLLFVHGDGLLGQARGLRRRLREHRPALVHSSLFRANLVTRLAAAGTGIPVLNSLVNDSYGPERFADPRIRPWRLRVVQGIDAVTGRLLADHFHAVSESVARAARRRLAIPADRITVVHRGRDPERLGKPSEERRRRARAALGLPEDAEVVLTVGREDYQKGQDMLLDTFALLAPGRPHLHLVLAGRSGSATPLIDERLHGLSQSDRVHRLGHRDDVPELLSAADLFAFPSRFEGHPGAVLEALALGLPIVASDIAPVREILGDTKVGLMVPLESTAELGAAIIRLLDHPVLQRQMGEKSAHLFIERYTARKSVERIVSLYKKIEKSAPETHKTTAGHP